MLLDVNLYQLRKTGLSILILFAVGTLGTVIGVFVATFFIKDKELFGGLYHALGGMITGTYTGGSINFNAVALHYDVMETGILYTSAVAVDNIITTLWFFITIALPVGLQRWMPRKSLKKEVPVSADEPQTSDEQATLSVKIFSFWIALTGFSLLLCDFITGTFDSWGFNIPGMIVLTTLALFLAQIPAIQRIKGNMFLGSWAIYLFLAVIGAFCDFSAMGEAGTLALNILGFILITVVVHGFITFGVAYVLGYDWEITAIASQANIGGGTTAMALAKGFNRNELILPAIIIGSVGNALGTYLGFLIAGML